MITSGDKQRILDAMWAMEAKGVKIAPGLFVSSIQFRRE